MCCIIAFLIAAIVMLIWFFDGAKTVAGETFTKIRRTVGVYNDANETQVAAGVIDSVPILDYTHTYWDGQAYASCDECPNGVVCPTCPQYAKPMANSASPRWSPQSFSVGPGGSAQGAGGKEASTDGLATGVVGAVSGIANGIANGITEGMSAVVNGASEALTSVGDVAGELALHAEGMISGREFTGQLASMESMCTRNTSPNGFPYMAGESGALWDEGLGRTVGIANVMCGGRSSGPHGVAVGFGPGSKYGAGFGSGQIHADDIVNPSGQLGNASGRVLTNYLQRTEGLEPRPTYTPRTVSSRGLTSEGRQFTNELAVMESMCPAGSRSPARTRMQDNMPSEPFAAVGETVIGAPISATISGSTMRTPTKLRSPWAMEDAFTARANDLDVQNALDAINAASVGVSIPMRRPTKIISASSSGEGFTMGRMANPRNFPLRMPMKTRLPEGNNPESFVPVNAPFSSVSAKAPAVTAIGSIINGVRSALGFGTNNITAGPERMLTANAKCGSETQSPRARDKADARMISSSVSMPRETMCGGYGESVCGSSRYDLASTHGGYWPADWSSNPYGEPVMAPLYGEIRGGPRHAGPANYDARAGTLFADVYAPCGARKVTSDGTMMALPFDASGASPGNRGRTVVGVYPEEIAQRAGTAGIPVGAASAASAQIAPASDFGTSAQAGTDESIGNRGPIVGSVVSAASNEPMTGRQMTADLLNAEGFIVQARDPSRAGSRVSGESFRPNDSRVPQLPRDVSGVIYNHDNTPCVQTTPITPFYDLDPNFITSRERMGACTSMTGGCRNHNFYGATSLNGGSFRADSSDAVNYGLRGAGTARALRRSVPGVGQSGSGRYAKLQGKPSCASNKPAMDVLYGDYLGLEGACPSDNDCEYLNYNGYVYKEPCGL